MMQEKNTHKRILLLSRKYPPSVGGMQSYTRDFVRRLEGIYDVDKIVLGKSQAHLIWFLPYLSAVSVYRLMTRKYDIVYLCDALLSPLGAVLKSLFGVKTVVTVHGLDITYDRFFYQRFVPPSVAKMDKVICVSSNTMAECLKRGVPREKCSVITNGYDPERHLPAVPAEESAAVLRRLAGSGIEGKKVLISVGRLIRRKGMDWFIPNVMNGLGDDYVMLVAGDGPERDNISRLVRENSLEGKVKLLGRVDDGDLGVLYAAAHTMIMPNQRIEGDPEGFGIVAVEAASRGVPVIANAVDGVAEAVLDGATGRLVDYNDADGFRKWITDPGLDRGSVARNSRVFSWENVIERYRRVLDEL